MAVGVGAVGPGISGTSSSGGGSGTVTSVSVVSANGLAGTVATATTTPAITIKTTVTAPVLAGNGTAVTAATTTGTGNTAVLSASPALTGVPTAPTGATGDNTTQIATDAFVTTAINNAIAGVNPAVAVQAATTAAGDTSALTYNNGASGIGATLTGANNTALTVDGFTFSALGQRLLVKNDTQSPAGAFNGVYFVTQLQATLLPVVLTRALDYDQPSDINNTGAIPVVNGTANALTQWLLTSQVTTVGTDPLTYAQFGTTVQIPQTTQSGTSYTLALTDAETLVRFTNASTATVTIPTNASVAFPVGTVINLFPEGAGGIILAAAGGVTIDNNTTASQNQEISLRQDAANVWVVAGGPSASSSTFISQPNAPYAVTSNHQMAALDSIVLANASGGAFTVTLPAAPFFGALYAIEKSDSSGNAVTVAPGAGILTGISSLTTQFRIVLYMFDGTNWCSIPLV